MGVTIATVISCIVIMAALMIFIKKSKSGQAMLAVSEDKDAAQLMGVNVNKTISLTFAIGSLACRDCWCIVMFCISDSFSVYRSDAWYQGIRCGGIWWYRFYSGSVDWWYFTGSN